ncbi:MAG: hypothetical protein ACKO21_12150 [Nodosilinea sp.]
MSTENEKPDKENSKIQVLLAVIGLVGTVGVALVSNWADVFHPKEPTPVIVLPKDPLPDDQARPNLNSAKSFNKALELEQSAITRTLETVQSEKNLNEVIQIWQSAIWLIKQVNPSDGNYSLAVQKLSEYENQLRYTEALRYGIIAGSLAQKAGEINTLSMEEWQNIENLWGQALDKLKEIPATDSNYTRARQKIVEYGTNQSYAKQAKLAAPYIQGVRKASDAGNKVLSAQSQESWLVIASLWDEAIILMGKVSYEYEYYLTAQEKIGEYQAKLKYAQQQVPNWQ